MPHPMLFQSGRINEAIKPQTFAGAQSGDWICMKGFDRCLITVHIAQANAATTALTVDKGTGDAVGQVTGITLYNWWECEDTPLVTDTFTKGVAAASITTSATGTGSSIYLIDIHASDLGDGYDWIQLEAGASNVANILGATYTLYHSRYGQATPISAIVA